MDEIEVEAVDSLDEVAVSEGTADYVLYGGKGGVGKTTMAAATALASANQGTATLVVSTDPAHSLSDTLGVDVPTRPGRLREDVPLYGVEIDPEDALDRAGVFGADGSAMDGLDGLLGGMGGPGEGLGGGMSDGLGGGMGDGLGGGMGDGLGDGPGGGADAGEDPAGDAGTASSLAGSMPGADEAAAMQLLLDYLDDDRFDRVVVDTAPTGHTLRLLELPEIMDSMMGRMLQFRERLGGLMDGLKGMFGAGEEESAQDAPDLEELRERVERLRAVLRDPARTDFRIVMVPEEMSVAESKRLRGRLEEFGIPVGTVVVNRVMEPLADVADAGEMTEEFVEPNLEDCEFCARRWDVQQDALAAAQELFGGLDVERVPLFAEEVRGERSLRLVAACLA